ncbi:hypothetical protein [Actinotalea sp. C106]|uniref:hypothetical protein n=1 Tax=Actinotalea sp. C106 TaxID=2908644 RepID=UPI0020293F30|nr:hypothetical protein [Actinotalea sp. C106]
MTGEPDVLARAIAVAALALTVLQMVLASRRGLWTRRAANVGDLRRTLEELRSVLDSARDTRGAGNLWTQTMDAHMFSLREQVAEVPDRKLSRLARRLHDEVVAIRGMATPTNEDLLDRGVSLNVEQQRLLERARADVGASLTRVSVCIRMGGRQG